MKEEVQKIRFKGEDYILTCPDDDDSPVATIEQYQKGECSYAHLYKKTSVKTDAGKVMRFSKRIGWADDIEYGELVEIEIDPTECLDGMAGDTWPI